MLIAEVIDLNDVSDLRSYDDNLTLNYLDIISRGVPWTPPTACHLLYHLVSTFHKPEVVEIACCFGKATLYLAAAAKRQGGFVSCADIAELSWEGRSAVELLRQADLLGVCRIALGRDARWYLLDLLRQRQGQWIDLAFIDLTHTVEVDSFVALALWTHLRPGGILVFDDLDWVPAVNGIVDNRISEPTTKHVQVIFDYISGLSDVAEKAEWGQEEVAWRWGFLRKRYDAETDNVRLRDLLTGSRRLP